MQGLCSGRMLMVAGVTGLVLVTPGLLLARQHTAPDLVAVPIVLDTIGPTQGTIAVSTRGILAFTPPAWEGETTAMLRVLDPEGGTRFLGVSTGKGPGELSVVLRWFFEGDSLLHAFDPTTLRISTFTAAGEFRRSHQLSQVGLPVRIADDSVDLARGAGLPWSLVRLSLTTGGNRTLLDASAPGFERLFPLEPGTNAIGSRRQPAVLPPDRSSTETVLANDLTYSMIAFDAGGTTRREGGRSVRPRKRSPQELERAIEPGSRLSGWVVVRSGWTSVLGPCGRRISPSFISLTVSRGTGQDASGWSESRKGGRRCSRMCSRRI